MNKKIDNSNESGDEESEEGASSEEENLEEGKDIVGEMGGDKENILVTHVTEDNQNIETPVTPPESLMKFLKSFFMALWLIFCEIFCHILAFIIIKKKCKVDESVDDLEDQGRPSTILYKKGAVELKDKRSPPSILNEKVKCQVDGTNETNLPRAQPTRSSFVVSRYIAAGILVVGSTDWLASMKCLMPNFKLISGDKTEFVDEYLTPAVQNKDQLKKSCWCVKGCRRFMSWYCSEKKSRLVNDTSD